MSRKALIAGATGAVGQKLLQRLLDCPEYSNIYILTRRSTGIKHPKIVEQLTDYNPLPVADEFPEMDDIYCCLGTTRKKAGSAQAFRRVDLEYVEALARLAKQLKASRFAVISSAGAGGRMGGLYLETKRQMEMTLTSINLPYLVFIRPGLLHGERSEFRLGEKLGYYPMKLLSLLPVTIFKDCRPVNTDMVADAMLKSMFLSHPSQNQVTIIDNSMIFSMADTGRI